MPKIRISAGAGWRTLSDSAPTSSPTSSNSSTDDEEHLHPPEFSTIMTFVVISSILASLLEGFLPRKLLRFLPQPVILMLIYVIAGAIAGKPFAVEIEAEMILTIFLPALLTNEALKIKTTPFYKSLLGLMWLIGPALFLGAAIVAVYPYAFFPEQDRFNWNVSMAFGGMLATTDPIAVSAMVSGESLLNDATSIICVSLFLGLNTGKIYTAGDLIFYIVNQLIFSVLWGIAIGMATFAILRVMKVLDAHTLFALSIATPYLVFTIATYYFHDSGVLALIPVGLFFNHFMSGVAGEEQVHAIQEFWETLSFLATSWLYSLTGLLVGIELVSHDVKGVDWAHLFGLYFWVLLARFIVVFTSLPIFMCAPGGYGFNVREAVLLAWGGLRGAVGLLLALIIKGNPGVSQRNGQLVLFMMAGIVVLVQAQGITFPLLLKYLKVVIQPNARVHDTMRTKMSHRAFFVMTRAGVEPDQAREMLRVHKEDKERPKEPCSSRFSTRRREAVMVVDPDMFQHPLTSEWVSKSVLNDKRRRLLQAQRATYNNLISRELISRTAWLLLTRGIEIQLDQDEMSMNQWDFLLQSTPQACCMKLGIHTTEERAVLNALFSQDLKNFLRIKEEFRERQLIQSQRSRGRSKLGGIVRKVSFDKSSEDLEKAERNICKTCFSCGDRDSDALDAGEEMQKRDFGLDCQDALTFGYMSWAFLIAQNHSSELIFEMFKLDAEFTAFETEQLALKAEIEQSCTQPALYLDILLEHFPNIARKIKSSQAVAEVKNQVYGYAGELYSSGLIEMHAMKKLIRDADKIVRAVKPLDFPLEPPYSVGPNGEDVLKCPNFHPFFQSDLLKKVSLEEFGFDDDVTAALHEALEERQEPITEGFWARRSKGKDVDVSGNEESQLAFPDSSIDSKARDAETSSLDPEDRPVEGGFGVIPVRSRHVQFAASFEEPEPINITWTGSVRSDPSATEHNWETVPIMTSPTVLPMSPTSENEEVQPTSKIERQNSLTLKRQLSGNLARKDSDDTEHIPPPSKIERQNSLKAKRQLSDGDEAIPPPPKLGRQSSLKLLRQLSGGMTAEDGEEIEPMDAAEYNEFLSSRPSKALRQTSYYVGKSGF